MAPLLRIKTGTGLMLALVLVLSVVFYVTRQQPSFDRDEIVIGGLFDLSGPVSPKAAPYAFGVIDATRWINAQGGINSRKVTLLAEDYGHDSGRALMIYRDYVASGIQLMQGWGDEITEALISLVNRDAVVFMSSAHAAHLFDPFYTPYNFSVATDDATAIRLAVTYIHHFHGDNRQPPKMVFIYPDNPAGRASIAAGKKVADQLGVTYGQDEMITPEAGTAIGQLNRVKAFGPDWVWLGGDLNTCAVIIKDAAKVLLDVKFMVNADGFDETLGEKIGAYADGRVYGVSTCAMFGEDVPGMQAIYDSHARYRGSTRGSSLYVRGWLSMLVMAEAIKRAGQSTDGRAVKAALEEMPALDFGELAAPISFHPRDHRPNSGLRIYRIDQGAVVATTRIATTRDPRHVGW